MLLLLITIIKKYTLKNTNTKQMRFDIYRGAKKST